MSATLDQSLNDALASMSSSEIKTFADGNLGSLNDSISNNLANAFKPALNMSIDSANNYDILTNYTINSKNLNTAVADLKDQQTKNINIASQNLANSGRVREIREWYYNNKLDTLFIFQLIFISLSLLGFVAYLMKAGIIGAGVFGALVGLLAVILILTIANRAVYTDKVRDKRYWSKRLFGVLGSPLPGGLVEQKCA
jgi:hypothetical protein